MGEILSFIDKYQGAIIAIATVSIAVSTIVATIITGNLARENRLLRKAETSPEVIAYLSLHPQHWTAFNFTLANVGRGPARNVSFTLDADIKDIETHQVALPRTVDRKAIGFLPQGESISVFFGDAVKLLEAPRLKPFEVVIEYQDMKGKHHCERCRLDVSPFEGFVRFGTPPEQEIADALKKIEKHLNKMKRS